VYGRGTWKFLEKTSLIVGARYNYDQLQYTYNQIIYSGEGPYCRSGSNNSSAVVGDISLQQQFTPQQIREVVSDLCNNLFNKIYYQDVEDFWNGPWTNTSTVIAQLARDAVRYGGVRVGGSF